MESARRLNHTAGIAPRIGTREPQRCRRLRQSERLADLRERRGDDEGVVALEEVGDAEHPQQEPVLAVEQVASDVQTASTSLQASDPPVRGSAQTTGDCEEREPRRRRDPAARDLRAPPLRTQAPPGGRAGRSDERSRRSGAMSREFEREVRDVVEPFEREVRGVDRAVRARAPRDGRAARA